MDMTKDEFLAYAEKHGDKRLVLDTAKQIQAEGLFVTAEELDRRLKKEPDVSDFYVNIQDERPHGRSRELNPAQIRAHARSDIRWKELSKLMAVYTGIGLLASAVSALNSFGKIGTVSAMVVSVLYMIYVLIAAPGIIKSFLDARRNEKISGMFGVMDRVLPVIGATLLLALMMMPMVLIPVILMGILTAHPAIAALPMILGMAGMVFIALIYSQAPYYCVDGDGPVASMKRSRQIMRGNKMKLFKTILPVIGWVMVLYAATSLLCAPIVIAVLRKGFSTVGAVIGVVLALIALTVMLVPLCVYSNMINAEFYDYINGKEMNPRGETTKAPIKIVSIVLVAATLLSCIAVSLPVKWKSLKDAAMQTGLVDEAVDEAAEDTSADVEDKETPKKAPKGKKVKDLGLKFVLPDGYEAESKSDYLSAYFSENDALFVHRNDTDPEFDEMQFFRDEYKAKDETIGELKGVMYTEDDEFSFVFLRDKYTYQITCTNESDLRTVIESI